MRNLFLLISFFTAAPLVIIASIVLLEFHAFTLNSKNHFLTIPDQLNNTQIIYAALPSTQTDLDGFVNASDTRVEKVKIFFQSYGSILDQYAQQFVTAADKYNLHYELLAAIMMQETQGCKTEIPNTFNCAGWGIYHAHTTTFNSYPEAIDTISRLLAQNYVQKGYVTPTQIQTFYNPTNTNLWAQHVQYFMDQIDNIL